MKKLALLGGEPIIKNEIPNELLNAMKWPIVTEEDENGILKSISVMIRPQETLMFKLKKEG